MARRLISPLNRVIAEKFFPTPHYSIKVKQLCNNYSTGYSEVRPGNSSYDTRMHNQTPDHFTSRQNTLPEGQYVDDLMESKRDTSDSLKEPLGRNVSKKDKIKFLVDTLLGLKESKEAVYGALDAWVAWEKTFPLASLRIAMGTLEKEQEWHRVIQVIKWILSKGQGNTMGMYRQLINALDMDHRTEEAHNFWMKKIGNDLHSVPWTLCTLMISIYYRNNMMERLVKLFKGLEAFDRKPPEKSVVQKVANAYEMLGLLEEKNRVLEKFNDLFTDTWRGHPKKSKKASGKKLEKPVERIQTGNSDNQQSTKDDAELFSYNQESNRKALIDKLQQIQSVV